ncbi:multifunctional CCA addition/repair protein [Pseudomonas baetica]|uniref:multifunctional CCA addition/repair protein n=1 Tax=Pseudomonas baetica TaxID=674054 RepID=UPI002406D0E8|nr:multifunctional CCA addition/repair protein [Pseudomonas baetica]MDF9779084.1 tRNA nucleotidyltransferase (CCA-adding enzyme) [Pseudomonas baetica]
MRIFKVGGAVRDRLLGREVNDVDWVVVGATVEAMLSQGYQPVGTDFPVFLHPVTGDEYALARTERQDVRGDGVLSFHASPDVTLEEDLARRDLTINSMAEDQSGVIIDPYGGQADLDARLLRHVAPAFAEDPVRVLRVARFAARYAPLGFTVAPETMDLMREIAKSGQLADQTAERMWKEIARALMEPCADVFIEVLRECGALKAVMPELDALFGVEQPAEHHPEIDTGIHVLMVLRQACRFEQPLSVRWAALTHDLGKGLSPVHTLPAHHGHEGAGVNLVKAVNARFKVPTDCAYLAKAVCELHTNVHRAFDLRAKTLLGLMSRLDAFRRPEQLANFVAACEMDSRGRLGFEDRDYPQGEYILRAADIAQAVQAKPYVERGLKGPAIGLAVREERLRRLHHYKEGNKAVALAS